MQCSNCGKEIPDTAQICEFCEASVQPEPSEEEKQAVREMLEQMGPEAQEALRNEFRRSKTAEEFANRIMVGELFPDGFTPRDEANAIVAMAFRNGPLEDLHVGEWSELLSNPGLSRITDDEIKTLMINACEQVAKLLQLKETDPEEYYKKMMVYNHMYCRRWERQGTSS